MVDHLLVGNLTVKPSDDQAQSLEPRPVVLVGQQFLSREDDRAIAHHKGSKEVDQAAARTGYSEVGEVGSYSVLDNQGVVVDELPQRNR